jgi:predicted GIY-YIG superfamily endonuclease
VYVGILGPPNCTSLGNGSRASPQACRACETPICRNAAQVITPEAVVCALHTSPQRPSAAEAHVPAGSGLYAWWITSEQLPGITGPGHPTDASMQLLYVGIARNLHDRVVKRHIRGGTASSTLRRSLASLLMAEGYSTRWTRTRVVLAAADEPRLSGWIEKHLAVSWSEHPEPKAVEAAVIATLHPPLNVIHNRTHPLFATVTAARASYRASAGPRPTR